MVAYKVRKGDNTWYTLGSGTGATAKIRRLDGTWAADDGTGLLAKVRKADGTMAAGVDFSTGGTDLGLIAIPDSVTWSSNFGTPTGTDPSNWSDYDDDSNYYSATSQEFELVQSNFYLRRQADIDSTFFASPWVVCRVRDGNGVTTSVGGRLQADSGSPAGFWQGGIPAMPTTGDLSESFTTFQRQVSAWSATDAARAWTDYSSVSVGAMTPVYVNLRPTGGSYCSLDVTFVALAAAEVAGVPTN